jgi:AcrR family transcriptional regulator
MQTGSNSTDLQEIVKVCDGEPDRSRQLIDAANELLEERGLDGLTVRAVLQRTGLARRAFYERFAGKDDLVLAVFEETLHAGALYYRQRARAGAEPIETIRMIVVGLVVDALDNEDGLGERRLAAMVLEHLRLAQSRPAELQAALEPLLDLITEQVTEGIRKGQLRQCDPELQATLIYNLVATTLHTELMLKGGGAPDKQRRQRLADEIWEFCRRAIVA